MIQAPEHHFELAEAAVEYVQFVGAFFAAGAIGFRYAAVRDRWRSATVEAERMVYGSALQRAAILGLVGAIIGAWKLFGGLPVQAARRHLTASALVTSDLTTALQVGLAIVALLGFMLAAMRRPAGWPLAAIGIVVAPFAPLVTGAWPRIVNPVHILVGGLWIGTLFMIVAAGIALAFRAEPARERRGAMVADMVNGFSPLALGAAGTLVLSGIVTAWRHLGSVAALWSSDYGRALILKLIVVGVVFALGAFNWRRQRPTLGSDATAVAIRRSSKSELFAAAVVLALTTYLLSLPAPARRQAPPPPAAAPTPPG